MGDDIDIQQQLDAIQQRNDELLNQTPAERNAEEVNKYYQEFLQAQTVKNHAPTQLKEAEERYYKARYGDKYMDVQQQKYTAESRQVLETMMEAHQAQLKKLDDKIKTYTSTAIYLKNMEEVQNVWLMKTKKWVDDINRSNVHLNHRNTFYADQEQNQLSYWILFENCILLSFVVVTMVLTFMGDKAELKMKVIGCTALLCILFFTNTILTWLRYLPKSVTFYTQWGYDPMESKIPWLLVVVFILFGAICVVYIKAITDFLENMTDRWNGRPPRHVDTRRDPNYPRYGRNDPRYNPYGVSPYGRSYSPRSPYDTTPYSRSPYDRSYSPRSPYDRSSPRSPYGRDPRWRPSPDELRRTRELLARR
jgi:hypothetical protein